ncbi:hypothetical protein EON66_10225, partial [archaeon]
MYTHVLASVRRVALRSSAAKYAYYSIAELKETDLSVLPSWRVYEKLVLAGWSTPTPHLLFTELERAMVRVSPTLCSHKMLYADRTSRDAMLWSMKACLASYLQCELGIDLEAEAAADKTVSGETAAAPLVNDSSLEASATLGVAAAASGLGRRASATSVGSQASAATSRTGSEDPEDEVDAEDQSLEARAVRRVIAWLD